MYQFEEKDFMWIDVSFDLHSTDFLKANLKIEELAKWSSNRSDDKQAGYNPESSKSFLMRE